MLAAAFFSLLEPAAEMARENPTYGDSYAWVPPAIGFSLGAVFILGCDVLLSKFGIADEEDLILASALGKQPTNHNSDRFIFYFFFLKKKHNNKINKPLLLQKRNKSA